MGGGAAGHPGDGEEHHPGRADRARAVAAPEALGHGQGRGQGEGVDADHRGRALDAGVELGQQRRQGERDDGGVREGERRADGDQEAGDARHSGNCGGRGPGSALAPLTGAAGELAETLLRRSGCAAGGADEAAGAADDGRLPIGRRLDPADGGRVTVGRPRGRFGAGGRAGRRRGGGGGTRRGCRIAWRSRWDRPFEG